MIYKDIINIYMFYNDFYLKIENSPMLHAHHPVILRQACDKSYDISIRLS